MTFYPILAVNEKKIERRAEVETYFNSSLFVSFFWLGVWLFIP